MLLLFLSGVRALPAQPGIPSKAPPDLALAISEFHAFWQVAWLTSENVRNRNVDSHDVPKRRNAVHCHPEWFADPPDPVVFQEVLERGYPQRYLHLFKGVDAGYAVCPTWLFSASIPSGSDESRWRDGALLPSLRDHVSRVRSALIARLEQRLRNSAGDEWTRGQLVRFKLDARDLDGARQAALGCRTPEWWCAGLRGLVNDRRGEVNEANTAFAQMRAAMGESTRCEWESLAPLVSIKAREAYGPLKCAERDSLNERVWWLADPLYRIAGNSRYVEQEVRRMDLALRKALKQDERYPLDLERGGDAVATVVERYGWPTYTAWGGNTEDQHHSGYLLGQHGSPPVPPYTSFEYVLDRVSTIPMWQAVATPFQATADQWNLAPDDSAGNPIAQWWPDEHFRHARRLVQLPEGQTVFIRRQNHAEVATALALGHPSMRQANGKFDVMLLTTTSAVSIDSIAQVVAAGGASAFMRGIIQPGPRLLAIEALGIDGSAIDGRTRFAVQPPPPLSAMENRAVSLSDVALLSALPDSALRVPNDELLVHMLPERRLTRGNRKVVLY